MPEREACVIGSHKALQYNVETASLGSGSDCLLEEGRVGFTTSVDQGFEQPWHVGHVSLLHQSQGLKDERSTSRHALIWLDVLELDFLIADLYAEWAVFELGLPFGIEYELTLRLVQARRDEMLIAQCQEYLVELGIVR